MDTLTKATASTGLNNASTLGTIIDRVDRMRYRAEALKERMDNIQVDMFGPVPEVKEASAPYPEGSIARLHIGLDSIDKGGLMKNTAANDDTEMITHPFHIMLVVFGRTALNPRGHIQLPRKFSNTGRRQVVGQMIQQPDSGNVLRGHSCPTQGNSAEWAFMIRLRRIRSPHEIKGVPGVIKKINGTPSQLQRRGKKKWFEG